MNKEINIIYCNSVLNKEGIQYKTFYFNSQKKALKNVEKLFDIGISRASVVTFRCELNEEINKEDFIYL